MKIRMVIAMSALGLCPAWALATGPYIGAAGAYVEHPSYSDVDGTFGGKVFAGYRFTPAPIFVEASYLDAGKADVSSLQGVSLGFKGYTVGAGYFAELSSLGSGAWLRASFYSGKSKLTDRYGQAIGVGSFEENSSGAAVGIGGQWKPVEWFGIRVEYESLIGAKDFANDKGLGLLSLGLVFEFGQERGAYRSSAPYAAPAAAAAAAPAPAPAPVAMPSAMPTAVPGPVPAAAPAVSGSSVLATKAELKVQPRGASSTQLTLPAGSSVQASRQISNDEGSWFYVTDAAGHTGWVPAQALAR